jgi:hypothetical protein
MWPLKKKVRRRRLEVRKAVPPASQSLVARFRRSGGVGAVLLVSGFYVVALLMDIVPLDPLPYRVGQYLGAPVCSRVPVKLPAPALIEQARRDVQSTTPATFVLNVALVDEIVGELQRLPDRLPEPPKPAPEARTQPATQPATRPAQQPATRPAVVLDEQIVDKFGLSVDDLPAWWEILQPPARTVYDSQVRRLREKLARTFLVSSTDAGRERYARTAQAVRVLSPAGGEQESLKDVRLRSREVHRGDTRLGRAIRAPRSTQHNKLPARRAARQTALPLRPPEDPGRHRRATQSHPHQPAEQGNGSRPGARPRQSPQAAFRPR